MSKNVFVQQPGFSFSKIMIRMIELIISILLISIIFQSTANAHRGAKNEIDRCRFTVGSEIIHFSAYTPAFSGGEGFCRFIPNIGQTHLVFDYEGHKLRKTTVEFEITKEPEGTRIYYQKPEVIKKGSVDAQVNFDKAGAGAGNYLAHVTIVYQGKTLDSHLPFSVGIEPVEESNITVIVASVILILIAVIVYTVTIRKFNARREEGK
ncbi:MAG: hypothetical protein QM500_13380 [Methylococcales bacterium]